MRSLERSTGGIRLRRTATVMAILLLAWGAVDCTAVKNTSRRVADAVTPGGSRVRHTAAVIGMESQFGPSRIGFDAHFARAISDLLSSECGHLLAVEEPAGRTTSVPMLPSGRIDGFGLAALGRARGLEYFIIGTLNGLTLQDEKKGFWFWKGTRYKMRVSMRLEIVDSASGTKVLDESFSRALELDDNRYEALKEAPVPTLSEIAPALDRLLQEAADRTCAAVKDLPWQGFIAGSNEGRITILTGSAAGLATGARLEVFGPGRLLQNKEGLRFFKPGDKVGEAEVTSVTPDRSEAVLTPPQPGLAGGIVRLR